MRLARRRPLSARLLLRLALGILLGTALDMSPAGAPHAALAQTGEAASAEALAAAKFVEARRFLDQGKFEEACRLFDQSQKLDPSPGTLLNLGNCREQQRDLASAFAAFSAALELARRESDPVRLEAFSNAAQSRIELLLPRVATLVLRSSPTPGAVARLNGQTVPGTGPPLRLNPGDYRMEVSATGHETYVQELKLEAGQRLELPIPVLLAPAGPTPTGAPVAIAGGAAPAASSGGPPPGAASLAVGGSQFGITPYLVMGGGALLVGTGIVIGQLAAAEEDELDSQCDQAPAPGQKRACPGLGDKIEKAESLARGADVLWIAGAVVAGVGITLFVLDDTTGEEGASLSGSCTLTGCALSGTF